MQEPKKHKRTELIVAAVKAYIANHALRPGDRLPQETELMHLLTASKGTVREALRMLEGQGLVESKTGPGGGVFIAQPSVEKSMELMGNYFFFNPPSIQHVYEVRKALEPILVQGLQNRLSQQDYQRLEHIMAQYAKDPENAEQATLQRQKELEFHLVLCSYSNNSFLSLTCQVAIRFLMELSVCQDIYAQPNFTLRAYGYDYQRRLLNALKQDYYVEAAHIMRDHMQAAQEIMAKNEISLRNDFIQTASMDGFSKELQALSAHFSKA